MSKIGRLPIEISQAVTVTIDDRTVAVKGSKGELSYTIPECLGIVQKENFLHLTVVQEDADNAVALWGTARAMVSNMIVGVEKEFTKKLQIIGVGYKAQAQGKKLVLSLGFSHPIEVETPVGISITVEDDIITVSGVDKQAVGQAAAVIRAYRKPEPYKGKGIRYVDEYVRRKSGKVAAGASESP